jgi:hypothetical protein
MIQDLNRQVMPDVAQLDMGGNCPLSVPQALWIINR